MKKGRLFPKIIYYIFTFLLGIFLALTLPQYFYNFNKLPNFIADSLNDGDFYSAMLLTANYFNKQPVLSCEFESGGGIVLFETVMPAVAPDEEDATALQEGLLYKTFWGFVYGVERSYETYSTDSNKTKLVITELDDAEPITVRLLDFDYNDDGKLDGIATYNNYGFIVLDIADNMVNSIGQMQLIDRDGEIFWTSDQLSLNFESDYFAQFDEFIEQFNLLIRRIANAGSDDVVSSLNAEIENLYLDYKAEYTSANPNNIVVDGYNEDYTELQTKINKSSNVVASLIIVTYFICIYIIADFLLGSHYIIAFFRWFLYKVCKLQPKNKQKLSKEEVFGHDYFSMVTMSLDLTDLPDFSESVQVKYTNSDVEIVFILLKENNYTATERIKAGTYVNPFIDMNRAYAPVDLPDNLEVEGYKMDVKIKIIKREV